MEQASWPKRLNGPHHDIENGSPCEERRRQYWREPDETSDDSTVQDLYHHNQTSQIMLSKMPSMPALAKEKN